MDGVARTRYAISRNTLVQLKMSVLRDILHLLGPICSYRPSENMILFHLPPGGNRPEIYSEWFLIPLEDVNDQRRLLSTQFSAIYLNEVREIDFDIVSASAGRVGRWPRVADGGCTFPFILMDTNPPASMSELWKFAELDPPENLLLIRQPGAYSGEADWLEYLPKDYYNNLMTGRSEEWINVHVHGEYGRDPSGQAVFGHCFERKLHAKQTLMPIPGVPLLLGVDPGLNPAAVLGQIDPDGGARILAEAYAAGMGTAQFIRDHVRPLLSRAELYGRPVIVTMDPAGLHRNPNSEDTAYGIYRKAGFDVRIAGTNAITPRINVVERHMVEYTRRGVPRLAIDPLACTVLVSSLGGEYRYKRMSNGNIDPIPVKNHPWSDVVDALGYLLLGAALPQGTRPRQQAYAPNSAPSALAWT